MWTSNPLLQGVGCGDLGRWQRGHAMTAALGPGGTNNPTTTATLYSSTQYWGFDLTVDGKPTKLSAQGLFFNIVRAAYPAGPDQLPATPQLTAYCFLVS